MTIVSGPGIPQGSVPHLRIPFALDGTGAAETVEQGTNDEVIQCVAVLVGTRPGTRYFRPSYGITDPTFGGINTKALLLAAQKWEPRAIINVIVTPDEEEIVTVQVAGGTP
jgi:phage baseplate assembly protein W